MALSDDAEPCSYSIDTKHPHIVSGKLAYRVDGGPLAHTNFYLEVTAIRVLLRYDDGVDHIGRPDDDIVAFFSDLVPSLSPVAS